ncbi:hypothetical protein A0H81_09653 [Grifola frondosa]|uniref:Uncharacterized protein n=1 Tax=Grifola frondosa TaxID=5627 RepID=A0A1C7LZN0_GRIFR|nr:hypothetical protein A0H81_09653 [Grifola frondosa]
MQVNQTVDCPWVNPHDDPPRALAGNGHCVLAVVGFDLNARWGWTVQYARVKTAVACCLGDFLDVLPRRAEDAREGALFASCLETLRATRRITDEDEDDVPDEVTDEAEEDDEDADEDGSEGGAGGGSRARQSSTLRVFSAMGSSSSDPVRISPMGEWKVA